jgi:hypothetical protein
MSVALFQSPKSVLVKDGTTVPTPSAPVIAGRPGMLRVYVTPAAEWARRSVTAELHLLAGGVERSIPSQKLDVSMPSDDAKPGSAFDFALGAADVPPGVTLSMTLRDDAGASMRVPSDGSALDLHALAGMTVKIKVVPFQYNGDGSGRVSDTSAPAMKTLHDAIFAMYPTASVEVAVRAQPLALTDVLTPMGGGWANALAALAPTRASDAVPDDTYIIGLVDPATTLATFCPSGCVTTFGNRPVDKDVSGRITVLAGFPETVKGSSATALGTAMGRLHAPCGGAANPDPMFPYANGRSPTPGFDIVSATFVPSGYGDLMSFCTPSWVTDYTFAGLAKRIAVVNGQ